MGADRSLMEGQPDSRAGHLKVTNGKRNTDALSTIRLVRAVPREEWGFAEDCRPEDGHVFSGLKRLTGSFGCGYNPRFPSSGISEY